LYRAMHSDGDGYCIALSKGMFRVDSWIFQWRLNFLIKIIVLAACLQKTGSFACN